MKWNSADILPGIIENKYAIILLAMFCKESQVPGSPVTNNKLVKVRQGIYCRNLDTRDHFVGCKKLVDLEKNKYMEVKKGNDGHGKYVIFDGYAYFTDKGFVNNANPGMLSAIKGTLIGCAYMPEFNQTTSTSNNTELHDFIKDRLWRWREDIYAFGMLIGDTNEKA